MKFHGFCMLKIRIGDTVVFFTLFLVFFIHLLNAQYNRSVRLGIFGDFIEVIDGIYVHFRMCVHTKPEVFCVNEYIHIC